MGFSVENDSVVLSTEEEIKQRLIETIKTDCRWIVERIENGILTDSDVTSFEATTVNLRRYWQRTNAKG